MKYRIFKRSWYKNGKPHVGRKTLLAYVDNVESAIDYCTVYNNNHKPTARSIMAEFERVGK